MSFVPARVTPPPQPLGRLRFIATFVRNPIEVVPQAVYEQEFFRQGARIFVTAPALLKAVLLEQREQFGKLAQIRFLGPLLGRGILTSQGAHWRWQRQAASPMFRREELLRFVPTFVRAAHNALARWRNGAV